MKNYVALSILIGFFFFSCNQDQSNSNTSPSEEILIEEEELIDYAKFLKSLNLRKKSIKERKKRFFTFINKEIPSYWIGTKWDFNGTSRKPKEGNIACGYFVTNTLSDFGFPIKRIFLAQQASSVMIKQLSDPKSIKHPGSVSQLIEYLKNQPDKNIFIIGLDYHTGYIIKDGENHYFLHSYFVNNQGIIKEKVSESDALSSSNTFMIGSLSTNNELFRDID